MLILTPANCVVNFERSSSVEYVCGKFSIYVNSLNEHPVYRSQRSVKINDEYSFANQILPRFMSTVELIKVLVCSKTSCLMNLDFLLKQFMLKITYITPVVCFVFQYEWFCDGKQHNVPKHQSSHQMNMNSYSVTPQHPGNEKYLVEN